MKRIYLCHKKELRPYKTRQFDVEVDAQHRLNLFLLNQDGTIRAYLNYCPHLGIQLNWQPNEFLSLEQTHIICAVHGALFELENGLCSSGPCRGDKLTALPIEIADDGSIYFIPTADMSLPPNAGLQ